MYLLGKTMAAFFYYQTLVPISLYKEANERKHFIIAVYVGNYCDRVLTLALTPEKIKKRKIY